MKIEIEKSEYAKLLAIERQVIDFKEAMDELAYGGDHRDDPDFMGNEGFDAEGIADLVMKHFNLHY